MTTKPQTDVVIGILNYHTKHLLKSCLDSVVSQKTKYTYKIHIHNNSPEENISELINQYPAVIEHTYKKNVGFCKGHNDIIRETKSQYYFCLNSDVILKPEYIEKCINILNADNSIAAVTGKLLWYDKKNNAKTNIIDSTGIEKTRWYRFYDRGQGEIDSGQYDNKKNVFGVSAAAAIYRRDALEKVKDTHGYFDERFFSYKEDIDLSLRFNNNHFFSMFIPGAIAYHMRGTHLRTNNPTLKEFIQHRKKIPFTIQLRSLKNHLLLIIKYILS